MALALSTKAKIAAATLTALSVMSGAFSANAQQMSANGTAPQQASLSAKCAPIKDIADQTACEIIYRRAERLDQLRASTQSANNDIQCTDTIKSGIQTGQFTREKLAAVLAGRPAAQVGPCNILAQLKS
jgi:hypothetical protein